MVDGIMLLTSYKEDSFGLTTTFYNENGEEEFCVKSSHPFARIKSILPVKANYIFDNGKLTITGIMPI